MQLLDHYEQRKDEIKSRIQDFAKMVEKTDEEIFEELVFCLMTPQSKARTCDRAVKKLKEKGLLLNATKDEIRLWIAGVRFPNAKSNNIAEAQKMFSSGTKIKDKLNGESQELRKWFVANVKGLGYKESSHFYAILD